VPRLSRATAFTFCKVLQELALRFSHTYFYVVAKAGSIKDSRVNAVALPDYDNVLLYSGAGASESLNVWHK
jgi:hypothetical protein